MSGFSDNRRLRQQYLQEQKAPTQSMIKRKMTPNLAAIFFEFMNPKQKVLVGLEPPLQGGGSDWYVPPKELLEKSRTVLKPLDRANLTKLNHSGIAEMALKILSDRYKHLNKEKKNMMRDSDIVWQKTTEKICQEHFNQLAQIQKEKNTEHIKQLFDSFSDMYRTSLNSIEKTFHEGLIADVKKMQEGICLKMKKRYDALCKSQASLITHEATAKLKQEQDRLQAEFIENVETCRTEMTNTLHDLNVDKHVAIEHIRAFLEHQKLACQIFVCLKEKEEYLKEMEESKHKHKKNEKYLNETAALLDLDIRIAEHKASKQQELNSIWQKKVSLVVKKFQMFVSYCLNTLPDHAEFFINLEKLMMLQVNETLEDPSAESIIAVAEEQFDSFKTPGPQTTPFYLICDTGNKTNFTTDEGKQDIWPNHNSSLSRYSKLPVIYKQCLYAACDNFEQFTKKIQKCIPASRGDEADIKDDTVYENFVPVKYTISQQLLEVQLESSLLQVLQQEMSNVTKVPLAGCEKPNCFCKNVKGVKKTTKTSKKSIHKEAALVPPQSPNYTASPLTDKSRLEHNREPKLNSYTRYTEPKTCGCAKSSKNHLGAHLPAYMTNMSTYDGPELPNYETCPVVTLKKLVSQARGQKTLPSVVPISPKTKDSSTQCADREFDLLCSCFSHSKIDVFEPVGLHNQCSFDKVSPSYLLATKSSFAVDRAYSLRKLIEDAPELIEIFKNKR